MNKAPDKNAIERQLNRPLSLIPPDLRNAFHAYQLQHYKRFLLVVNLLGQIAYFSYGIADAIAVPDVAAASFRSRLLFLAMTLPVALGLFRWLKKAHLLDLVLPTLILVATITWFQLLSLSISPAVATYQYASVIFIVLANLAIQVRFLPALAISFLIALATLHGVYRLSHGDTQSMVVFSLVYLPVVCFSLFISWSATLDRRRTFLRSVLDDKTRQALYDANAKLQELAHYDPLTGVSNRRHFEQQGLLEVARARRHDAPLCLLMMDIDHFKRINDTHGHAVGDQVLQVLAESVQAELRENDLLARLGGEEFAVLLPNTTMIDARAVADRVRVVLANAKVTAESGAVITFTASMGLAKLDEASGDLKSLLEVADKCLYRAKENGRNRVWELASA